MYPDANPLEPLYDFQGVSQAGKYTFLHVLVFIAAEADESGHFRAELKVPILQSEARSKTYAELWDMAVTAARSIVQTEAILPALRRPASPAQPRV